MEETVCVDWAHPSIIDNIWFVAFIQLRLTSNLIPLFREIKIRNTGTSSLTYKLRTTVYERYNAKRHTGRRSTHSWGNINLVYLKSWSVSEMT